MVAGALPANADVFALRLACSNGAGDQEPNRWVAFVKVGCQQFHAAVAIQSKRELRHVVGSDGEAVVILQELLGQNGIAGHFAHHDVAQAVFAALQPVASQQLVDFARLLQRAHEGDHDFHIGQAHFVAHALDGFALHGKGFGKVCADIARCTAEAEHGVFFFRLVAAAADQLAIFVALEIAHAHDDGLGIERSGNGGNAFGDFFDIESAGRSIAARGAFHRGFEAGVDIRIVQHRFGVNADVVVDDEFQARQPHAAVG